MTNNHLKARQAQGGAEVKNCLKVLQIKKDRTIVCKNPARSADVEDPLRFREVKLRRNSSFVHRAIEERRRRTRNPLRFHS
jgi:hypothetical protein